MAKPKTNTQSDTAVKSYFGALYQRPQPTREQERVLCERWFEHGDIAARDELVRSHLRYVVAIAIKYRRYGLPLAELIAEGNFGVVHALRKFEPARGNRFVTYAAYWIRAYILNYIIRSWSLVGVGSGALRSKMFFKLRRERVRITNLVGQGEHADELLAERINLPKEKVAKMVQRLDARDVSLDAKLFDDSGTTLVDTLVSSVASQEDQSILRQLSGQVRSAVRGALASLDSREKYIVERRIMADPEDELSLAEIGRNLGVSRERARQLEVRAKKKLKVRINELAHDAAHEWISLRSAA